MGFDTFFICSALILTKIGKLLLFYKHCYFINNIYNFTETKLPKLYISVIELFTSKQTDSFYVKFNISLFIIFIISRVFR